MSGTQWEMKLWKIVEKSSDPDSLGEENARRSNSTHRPPLKRNILGTHSIHYTQSGEGGGRE